MSDYITIKGQDIQVVSSDPANPTFGQIWYNTTSQSLKGVEFGAAAWATGVTLNNVPRTKPEGSGTTTAALAVGGEVLGSKSNSTEEYNGTSWTAGGNLASGRTAATGFGLQTASLLAGGSIPPYTDITEEYNGSTWTAGGNLPAVRMYLAGCGTQTAGLAFGGYSPPGFTYTSVTDEYNGTAWTAGGSLNTTKESPGGAGTQTAALAFGGYNPVGASLTETESYDGSTWTVLGATMGTGVSNFASDGTSTSAFAAGGNASGSATNIAQLYDGTSWAATANMVAATNSNRGVGDSTLALTFGGNPSSITQEFTGGGPTTVTISGS